MTTEAFDAAEWLARWTAAGGGYAGRNLLLPQPNPPFLRKMARDLSCEQIRTLALHMGADKETTE